MCKKLTEGLPGIEGFFYVSIMDGLGEFVVCWIVNSYMIRNKFLKFLKLTCDPYSSQIYAYVLDYAIVKKLKHVYTEP